ncbi:MAG: DMT family transporter [Gemmatimonadota bacterium]|nr:DMT family transporter [Gemmatimonadota bacterium]
MGLKKFSALPLTVWVGTGLVWGTAWGVIRIGLEEMPPFVFAASRTLLAAVTVLAFVLWKENHRRPPVREVGFWLWMGLPQIGIPYALIFWAEQYITSSLTAMLFATFPALTALGAHFLLKDEPLTWAKSAGTLLALFAVFWLVDPTSSSTETLWPSLAILVASVSAALGTIMVRRHGRTTSTMWITALQISSAGIFLLGFALVLEIGHEVNINVKSVLSVLYLAWAVTVGCYLGLFWLLKRMDATFVSMGVIFETAVGVFFGSAILGEALGVKVFGGLGLVAVSVYLVTKPQGKRQPTLEPPVV